MFPFQSSTEVKIFYKATETNETVVQFGSEKKKMVIGYELTNLSIGSNLIVQVAPAYTNGTLQANKSNPISIGKHMVHSLPSQTQFAN